ncbi:hypothetical protein TWF696_002295 [Orbilia brochopaga]|uniref:Uncharacterized protein n=1 Tax=Orbilia brochopaga TaxID=3140254 RepID=A0AAV9U846_9PEZI
MHFKAALLSAVLASTASSAALPLVPRQNPATGEIMHTIIFGSENGAPITPEYVNATDNVWKKVQLGIPLKVFGVVSDYIWISTNGVVSIEEPSADCQNVPSGPLPVNPAAYKDGSGTGCLPKNTLMPFWNDLALRPGTMDTHVKLILAWHPDEEGHISTWYHYHLEWQLCEKGVAEGVVSDRMPCGDASRTVYMTWGIGSEPDMIGFDFYFPKAGGFSNTGTIGVQSYPNSVTLPLSELKGEQDGEVVVVYFDTKKFTYEFKGSFIRPW